jgi:hypothetical protein
MYEKITQMLFSVIDELNQLRPVEEHLKTDLAEPLIGDFGKLDSAGLINFIVLTEQKTCEEFDVPILLTDERTLSQVHQVFADLGTLADYIQLLLTEKSDG